MILCRGIRGNTGFDTRSYTGMDHRGNKIPYYYLYVQWSFVLTFDHARVFATKIPAYYSSAG
jgi:hypothetical protein